MGTYKHGVYTSEQATSMSAPITGTAGLQVIVGTAPVNMLDNPAEAVNVPLLVNNYKEAVAAVGYDKDFAKFTLCEAISANFSVVGAGPLVLINVLDPAKHTADISSTTVQVNAGVAVLNVVTGALIRLCGCDPDERSPLITEAELKTIVNVSHEEGVLESEERTMINNVFDFGDSKAKDVMTPRTDIVAVPLDVTYEEYVRLVQEEGFSRMPVYGEDLDDIVGILYVKDVFFLNEADFSAEKFMREPFFTYESKPLDELLAELKNSRLAVAVVLDEYGGTSGMITTEDIVEEIVGEIEDEYDDEEEEIEVIKDNEFVVDGSTRLEDFNEMVGTELESEEVDTIAGYILLLLGNFPESGQEIETEGLRIIVEEMDKNRIEKLRVYK